MVASEVDNLNADKTTICKLHQKTDDASGETQYWYSDASVEDDNTADTGCTASAITGRLDSELHGTKLASGKLLKGQGEPKTINKDTLDENGGTQYDEELSKRVINTKDLKAKYYYLVVKYPNSNTDQAPADAGKTFSVKLSLDGEPAATLYSEPAA